MRTRCTIENCDEVVNGHGFCDKHYQRWVKYGDALGGDRNHAPPNVRFARRFTKGDGCWIWTGNKTKAGYGRFQTGGKGGPHHLAHRFSYELAKGPIPKGCIVMHSCDNPSCVNLEHLSVGTHKDNTADMIAKGRHGRGAAVGAKNGKAVLTNEDVLLIRQYPSETHAGLARRMGVATSTIRGVRSGRTWSHII
jgi:HNH endonuclease